MGGHRTGGTARRNRCQGTHGRWDAYGCQADRNQPVRPGVVATSRAGCQTPAAPDARRRHLLPNRYTCNAARAVNGEKSSAARRGRAGGLLPPTGAGAQAAYLLRRDDQHFEVCGGQCFRAAEGTKLRAKNINGLEFERFQQPGDFRRHVVPFVAVQLLLVPQVIFK